jgi:hypothetical protein
VYAGGQILLTCGGCKKKDHLEALVLQNFLNRNIVALFHSGLEDNAKRTVADDFTVAVRDLACLARLAVRGDDLDDLVRVVDR